MYCYVYDHYKENNLTTDVLLLKSLELYLKESSFDGKLIKGADGKPKTEVEHTEDGKPYFVAVPEGVDMEMPQCSVSHTGSIWACVISDMQVGVDIECVRERKFEKISAKYFTASEQEYVFGCTCTKGADGLCNLCGESRCIVNPQSYRVRERFFEIWTRKEAYGKLLGTGLGEGALYLDTFANGRVAGEDVDRGKSDVIFKRVELPPEIPGANDGPGRGIICTCCSREERDIKTRIIEMIL